MAVTVTTNTLSSRVRYLNVSASTANADAKDVILAMANALIALGWSRYDTAGATAVVGSDDNAGVILRRACYDTAQSAHFNYLGLRLVGTGTNTYTFHLIQAADWTGTTSMSNFVNAAAIPSFFTPNTTGNTRFMNFAAGGTIWLFDGGKTLLITSQSGSSLTKSVEQTWIVGEYKKEFGENVNAATAYIHNGVFTNDRAMFDGAGVSQGGGLYDNVMISVCGAYFPAMASTFQRSIFNRVNLSSTTITQNLTENNTQGGTLRTGTGVALPQFSLTEAPAIAASGAQNSVTSNRAAIAPVAVTFGFTTRMMMGWLGYIGHVNELYANSINAEFIGSTAGQGFSTFTPPTASTSVSGGIGVSAAPAGSTGNTNGPILFSARGSNNYPLVNSSSFQEYSPSTLPSNLLFTVYEPTLSCGTSNGLQTVTLQSNPSTVNVTYTGAQYKFSMLGRIFDLKVFGPFNTEKYVFLDSIIMPCDADGFFAVGGTNKEFWILPAGGNNIAFLMPK